MLLRVVSFTACQIAAGAAGWYLLPGGHSFAAAFSCALVGGYAWMGLDMLRAAKLLRWLQQGNVAGDTLGAGMWGEVSDRVRRLVRAKDRVASDSDGRLQDLLAALQASPNGVVLLEEQGRIEWFNAMAATHFGLDPARDRLQHFGNLVRDPGFAAYFAKGDFSGDVVMPGRGNTSSKPVKISVHLHPYGAGRSLLLSRDVTALEQAEAMRRDFVANVSHEIRTPLTVLAGFVETLQYLPLNDQERQRYLGLMSQQAQRMQSLVSDLLMLSRLEGSPVPNVQEWVSAKELLTQCEQDARDLASVLWTRSQDVTFDMDGECDVAGSASELLSAMSNLIGNAIRYTPADQFIGVHWKFLSNGSALFSVQDSGPGIAPEHIGRLTERFYRVDRSRSRDTGGTGLGLAIVKHVAQRHGAELLIESTPGKGSTFSILFPPHRIRQTSTHLALSG
jgi:two-component system phosphate regulon sensor histidine kinase PhoR